MAQAVHAEASITPPLSIYSLAAWSPNTLQTPMSATEEIKARLDILDIVSETVQLKRSGKSYSGFCPFHPNTRTPAFVVFPDTGTWRCFGQCSEGGDIFKYVMKREGWDFPEALRQLAEKAGVQLKPQTPQEKARREEHDHLRDLLEEAVIYYRNNLVNTPAGKEALEYFRQRGLSDQTIESFGLGYAPNSWEAAFNHFKGKGANVEHLVACGIVSERDSGGFYDRFRNRLMFPIRDGRGRMAGFGARILDPEDVPKYLNTPQTDIFDKGSLLYGLDKARKAIRAADQAVIVEGYMGVIVPHQAGFTNLVAPMGTALTEQQLRALKRLTKRIVLALDADAAGGQATLRGLQVARETMDRSADPVFDARGLVRHEGRLQADIRVTTLPKGLDPDDVVNRDPEEWASILENAKPTVVHVMETLAAGRDLEDAKVKTEIAAQVLPLIEDVPNPIEREDYRQKLARLLRVDERTLQSIRPARRRRRRRAQTKLEQDSTKHYDSTIEQIIKTKGEKRIAFVLGIIMRRPELLYQMDRVLKEIGLESLSPQDFNRIDYQTIFHLSRESLNQDYTEPLNYVLNHLPKELLDFADDLLYKTEIDDPNSDKVVRDISFAVLEHRQNLIIENNNQLMFLLEESKNQGDLKESQYSEMVYRNNQLLLKIQKALKKSSKI